MSTPRCGSTGEAVATMAIEALAAIFWLVAIWCEHVQLSMGLVQVKVDICYYYNVNLRACLYRPATIFDNIYT